MLASHDAPTMLYRLSLAQRSARSFWDAEASRASSCAARALW
jgi:hypothetical protein